MTTTVSGSPTRRASAGRVGAARAELLDAADVLRFGTAWMTEHLGHGSGH